MALQNIACVVGARPNFMKMAPILRALDAYPEICTTLVHTGQHYDANLSDVFFDELRIKKPDHFLNIGGGKQGVQTARMLEALEATLEAGSRDGDRFDRVVVVGDVNSTLAAALAAAKLAIPVAHVEAGLRSFDRTMPEEINRIVTDSLADMLFVSEPSGVANLRREGHPEANIHLVGNVMIDTLRYMLPAAEARHATERYGVQAREYGLVTFHRPANVDALESLSQEYTVTLDGTSSLKDQVGNKMNGGSNEVYKFTIDTTPDEVASVAIGAVSGSRSAPREVKINFDAIVIPQTGAFAVNKRNGGGAVGVNFATATVDNKTVATLTFTGGFVDSSGALVDGNYDLRIDATKLTDAAGNLLDGDGDGTEGDDYLFGTLLADKFFSLFGDAGGDGDVDGTDFSGHFIPAFGSIATAGNYRVDLDLDGDGDIDGTDFAAGFIPNYGKMRDNSGY